MTEQAHILDARGLNFRLPILRTSFDRPGAVHAQVSAPGATPTEDKRTVMPENAEGPMFWGLYLLSLFHTYGGARAIMIGLVVIVSALGAAPAGGGSGSDVGHTMAYCWGFGLALYGIIGCNDPSAFVNPWVLLDVYPGVKATFSAYIPVGDENGQIGNGGFGGFAGLRLSI